MRITYVRPDRLGRVWPTIEPWVKASLELGPDLNDPAHIFTACAETRMVLWVAIVGGKVVGFAAGQIDEHPKAKVCFVPYVGGEIGAGDEWLGPMFAALKDWARKTGCKYVTGGGRRGWIRKLGLKDAGPVLYIEVEDGQ